MSLAPSITESVFALGLGKQLVGATRYCRYPPEAAQVQKVGGFLDLNTEALLALRPSVVFGLAEHGHKLRQLRDLHLQVRQFEHRTISGILASLTEMGALCNVSPAALALRAQLEAGIENVRDKVARLRKMSVLVVVGGDEELRNVYLSGADGFYGELVELAGGRPVYRKGTVASPSLSPEGLLYLDPEVIFHVITADDPIAETARAEVLARWRRIPGLRAVAQNRVYLLTDDYASVPGPRFVALLIEIAKLLHPEAPW